MVFMPIFQSVLDFILQGIPKIREITQPVFDYLRETFDGLSLDSLPKLGEGFNVITETIMPAFQEVFTAFKEDVLPDFVEGIKNLTDKVFPVIQDAFKFITEKIVPPFVEIFKFIYTEIIPKFAAAFKEWMPIVGDVVKKLWTEFIKPILELIVEGFETAWPQIKNAVSTAVDIITAVITGVLKFLSGFIDFISGVLTRDWEKAWKGIQEIFSGVWEMIKSIAETAINYVVGYIDNIVGAVRSALEWLGILQSRQAEVNTSSGGDSVTTGKINTDNMNQYAVGTPLIEYDQVAKIHKGEAVIPADNNPNNPNARHPIGGNIYHVTLDMSGLPLRSIADIIDLFNKLPQTVNQGV
jgi:phage-related protein